MPAKKNESKRHLKLPLFHHPAREQVSLSRENEQNYALIKSITSLLTNLTNKLYSRKTNNFILKNIERTTPLVRSEIKR